MRAHERREPSSIDQDRARAIIDKTTAEYQNQVRRLITIISAASRYVPRRRDRKLHVGLFGYGRTLDGVGDEVTLPRAIGFAASMYSIGIPPELLGLTALDQDDLAFLREVYPSLDGDLRAALKYTNERHVRELLGDEYLALVGKICGRDRPGPRRPDQRHPGGDGHPYPREYLPVRGGGRATAEVPGVGRRGGAATRPFLAFCSPVPWSRGLRSGMEPDVLLFPKHRAQQ